MTATVHNTTQSHFISAFHCVADLSCDKLFVFKTLLQTARHIANRLLCRLGGLAVEKKKKQIKKEKKNAAKRTGATPKES